MGWTQGQETLTSSLVTCAQPHCCSISLLNLCLPLAMIATWLPSDSHSCLTLGTQSCLPCHPTSFLLWHLPKLILRQLPPPWSHDLLSFLDPQPDDIVSLSPAAQQQAAHRGWAKSHPGISTCSEVQARRSPAAREADCPQCLECDGLKVAIVPSLASQAALQKSPGDSRHLCQGRGCCQEHQLCQHSPQPGVQQPWVAACAGADASGMVHQAVGTLVTQSPSEPAGELPESSLLGTRNVPIEPLASRLMIVE